ncbi:hypothetical protein B0H13DRAFT_1926025 [Mycena leptocephala]|nr:hypothetical protein B0H13DRAFT_1926025 [Mycena leptocephala]
MVYIHRTSYCCELFAFTLLVIHHGAPTNEVKYCTGPTEYEIQAQRKARRNEMARLRMARKRAELKQQPLEEQARAKAQHESIKLHIGRSALLQCRVTILNHSQEPRSFKRVGGQAPKSCYIVKFGEAAYLSYLKAKRKRQLDKRRKKEAYHSADDQQHSDDEDQLQSEVDQPQSKADHDDERTNGYERDSEDDSSDDGLGDGGDGWSDGCRVSFDGYGRRVDMFGRRVDARGHRVDADGRRMA